MRIPIRLLALTLFIGGLAVEAAAQAKKPGPDLARATIEDLMNIEITSASRKEQRLGDVAAAIYVITQDDIRRSGISTLPELFRLVPGVQVSRVNANRWAISVRGFNNLFSNKLLVLLDGRSIYNRIFSGVFWDSETVLLDDIDRIEVIRGPGASVWGANAVNGVINIVTKSAEDTKGALVKLSVGGHGRSEGAVRYGGTLGAAAYRVYSQWSDQGHSLDDDGTAAGDDWRTLTTGFRLDAGTGASTFRLLGGFTSSASHPLWDIRTDPTPGPAQVSPAVANADTGNLLAHWTTTRAGGGVLEVQSFLTVRRRVDTRAREHERILDLELQYHTRVGARHDLVVGSGYRDSRVVLDGTFGYSLNPNRSSDAVVSMFAQDDIQLAKGLTMTLGGKLEHDTRASWGFQPTVRVMQQLPRRQRVWAGLSRALRKPSLNDLSMRVNVAAFAGPTGTPVLRALVGSPQYRTEELIENEAGYRFEIGTKAAVDVVAFRGNYNRLSTLEPLAPRFETLPSPAHLLVASEFQNLLHARTAGVEISAQVQPVPGWRLAGSYSGFHLSSHPEATSRDPAAAAFDGNAPAHQWQLHSSLALGPRTEGNVGLYRVGRLSQLQIPAYTRVDARIEIKLTNRLSVAASGENLFDRPHVEFSGANIGMTATRIPRNGHIRLTWRF